MYRAVTVFALALALALPAGAAPPAANLLTSQQPDANEHADLALDALFVELTAPTVGEPLSLEAEYYVDEALVFSETLKAVMLEEAADRPSVVELLAWHPEVRDRLAGAASRGADVSIDVTYDGATARFAVAELVERTHTLQEMGPIFAKHRSTVTFPATSEPTVDPGLQSIVAKVKDPACVNDCWSEYYDCVDYCENRGGPGEEDCIDHCYSNRISCINACPEECNGPTTRDYSDTVIIGFLYGGPTYCLTWSFWNYYFDYGLLQLKTTTYRETTYCDGTKTTVVLGITYSSYYCWLRSNYQCSFPVGDSFYYFTCPV